MLAVVSRLITRCSHADSPMSVSKARRVLLDRRASSAELGQRLRGAPVGSHGTVGHSAVGQPAICGWHLVSPQFLKRCRLWEVRGCCGLRRFCGPRRARLCRVVGAQVLRHGSEHTAGRAGTRSGGIGALTRISPCDKAALGGCTGAPNRLCRPGNCFDMVSTKSLDSG